MAKNKANSKYRSVTEPKKGNYACKVPYKTPLIVPLKKNDKSGCKHGNHITGDCATGGYPKGNMADCRNGANANDSSTSSCKKGSKPSIT